jgi:hypothetical protein
VLVYSAPKRRWSSGLAGSLRVGDWAKRWRRWSGAAGAARRAKKDVKASTSFHALLDQMSKALRTGLGGAFPAERHRV